MEQLIMKDVEEIVRKHVSDPSIGFFTITYVKMSADMKHAKIGISVMGSREEQLQSFDGLVKSTGYIQHRLAQQLTIKFTPKIEFVYDERKEFRIEELLSELKRERHEQDIERED